MNKQIKQRNGGESSRGLRRFLSQTLLPLVFWVAVWEIAARIIGKTLIFPSPTLVVGRLLELMGSVKFYEITFTSLLRILGGFLAGSVLGILLALLTSYVKVADWILSPAIRILRSIPVASFIILVLLWAAKGRVPGIVSAIMVLPIVWENTAAGIRAVPGDLLEMAKSYDMGFWKTWRLVRLPAILPYLLSGLSNAIGLAWKSGVAAEVLCVPANAIGTQVYNSKIYLETPDLFAWTLVVVLLSILIEGLIKHLIGKGAAAWK